MVDTIFKQPNDLINTMVDDLLPPGGLYTPVYVQYGGKTVMKRSLLNILSLWLHKAVTAVTTN